MLLERHRLAAEEVAPERVARCSTRRSCATCASSWLIEREEALAGREGLHRQRQAARRRAGPCCSASRARAGIAVVAEVLEQDRRAVPRLPVELLLVEGERVLERARDVGRQIGLDRVEIEKVEVLGFERREIEPRRVRRDVRRLLLLDRFLGLARTAECPASAPVR